VSFFEPSLSFRSGPSGGSVVSPPVRSPLSGVLAGTGAIVLLVHGYNNDQADASAAYRAFLDRQRDIGPIRDKMVAVYWPGDNWEGGLHYTRAIPKAKATARALADEVRRAVAANGYLRVKVLAHSLGCRVTLEMLRELSHNRPPTLVVERFVLMAAAVATSAVSSGRPLRQALDAMSLVPFMSLYSPEDPVLAFAFPAGQALAGEGFFPRALGHDHWSGPSAVSPPRLTQRRATQARHGHYWGGSRETLPVPVNEWIRQFLDIGVPPPRSVPARLTEVRVMEDPRTVAARVVGARTTPARAVA